MPYSMFNSSDFTPIAYIDWAVGIEPLLFPLILFAIFIIATVTGLIVSGGRFHKAFIFSSFLSLILSIMFITLGWSSKLYVGLSILMLGFSILINQLVESRY